VVNDLLGQLRNACAQVAESAGQVHVGGQAVRSYAASLPLGSAAAGTYDEVHLLEGTREHLAAFWVTLDAINFGSGWFPTLRKREGRSGYHTIAGGVRDRFAGAGPWTAEELAGIDAAEIAEVLGQDPAHELVELFARSLNDLGRHVAEEHDGRFESVVDSAGGSAEMLVELLAGWECFADASDYEGLTVPFLKRAQIAAADLGRAGVASFADLARLTMFADNLVPHVLRLDGVLSFAPELAERIEREELIEHGSPEEVEIRACAVHAVELIVAARPGSTAAEVDQLLWLRGQEPRYKAVPRHRSRCTAY
jgi:putative queuosine salvage protein